MSQIIVLSKSAQLYSTARQIEAIEQRGLEPLVLDYSYLRLGTMINLPKHNKYSISEALAIIPRISSLFSEVGAMVIQQFSSQGTYSTVHHEGLLVARNKFAALQKLQSIGIDVPQTIFPEYSPFLREIVTMLGGYPIIVKELTGTHGQGIHLVHSESELRNIIRYLRGYQAKFLLQEFIAEAEGADIRCFVVGNEVVAAMKRQSKQGDFRSNLHMGGSGELFNIDENIKNIAIQSAQTFGLDVAGVDILLSSKGPLVIEVNASPGLEGIEKATGVDIAAAIIEHVLKQV